VAMASLIGVPDDRLDEVGVAYVQLLRGATATEDELRAYLKTKLAPFKVPRRVVLTGEFPKTGSGKIQKFVLKRQYFEQAGTAG
jgi:fatty-acyl-CoA synthase